jgi:hypothetical protein
MTAVVRSLGDAEAVGGYRWRLWNVVGWHEEGFLPLRTVSYGWKRNNIGSLQGSLPIQQGQTPVRPGQHAVIVEKYGNPMWMGPVWSSPFDTGTAYVNLNGSEWPSMLRRRRVRTDLNPLTQWDQFDIARMLIAQSMQWWGEMGGGWDDVYNWGLHIDLSDGVGYGARALSGVLRDRTYLAIDRKEVYEAIQQLSEVINGFDYQFIPAYAEQGQYLWLPRGAPVNRLRMFYPREGYREFIEPLEYKAGWPGSNLQSYSWNENASEMANATMAANDETVADAYDSSAWDWYLPLEALAQRGGDGGVTREETLQQHADGLLAEKRRPVITCTCETVPNYPGLGPHMIGANVRFRATSWRHPPGPHGEPGIDQMMRIEDVTVNAPSDERAETGNISMSSIYGGEWL